MSASWLGLVVVVEGVGGWGVLGYSRKANGAHRVFIYSGSPAVEPEFCVKIHSDAWIHISDPTWVLSANQDGHTQPIIIVCMMDMRSSWAHCRANMLNKRQTHWNRWKGKPSERRIFFTVQVLHLVKFLKPKNITYFSSMIVWISVDIFICS